MPTITSFTPSTAGPTFSVSITGTNFTGATSVSFGGVSATSFIINSPTSITAIVGNGATGNVNVTTSFGTATKAGFIFVPAPTITSFTPLGGNNGSIITVNGTNLSNITSVTVGGVSYTSTYIFVSSNQIKIPITVGATGSIIITTLGGTAALSGFVYNPQPTVSSISPSVAGSGMTVNIVGTNFIGTTLVTLGGVPVSSYTINSPTSITAIVGNGASGNVICTNSYGININSPVFKFTSKPIINSFSPTSGPVGTLVSITGGNFNTNVTSNFVYFGAVRAEVVSATNLSISVKVPTGTTYENLSVTNNNLTAYTKKPFNTTFSGGNLPLAGNEFTQKLSFVAGAISSLNQAGAGQVKMADLDNDGNPDIIINRGDTLSIYKNITTNGTIAFAPKIDLISTDILCFETGDLDGDGKLDIIVARNFYLNGIIYKNTSNSSSISFTIATSFVDNAFDPSQIAIGDINYDGKPDFVITHQGQASIIRYMNTTISGSISVTPQIYNFPESISDPPLQSQSLLITDINEDGLLDIMVDSRSNHYYIIKGDTTTFNGLIRTSSYLGGLTGIVSADFNMDERPDVMSWSNLLNGIGNYNFSVTPTNLLYIGTICANDFDGDGKPDFANINNPIFSDRTSPVFITRNITTGSNIVFEQRKSYADGDIPQGFTSGDVDGDGKPDLVITNYQNNTFSILKNLIGVSQVCEGGTITLASNIIGITYQWQLDSGSGFININNNSSYIGANSASLQILNIPISWTNYRYRCLVGASSYSNVFSIYVNSNIPSVTISTANSNFCSTAPITFSANPLNAGIAPSYQWQVNGINSGTNSRTFTITPNNNDQIKVIVTSNSSCSFGTTASSTQTISLLPVLTPTIIISAPTLNVCPNTSITFSANITNGGVSPTIKWVVNNILILGATGTTFTTQNLTNNAQVRAILTNTYPCNSAISANSNILTISLLTAPIANAGNDTSICVGSFAQMNGSSGTNYSWTPILGLSNPNIANPIATPTISTIYTLVVSNINNCRSSDSVLVSVNQPSFSVPLISINDRTFTINNFDASVNYAWQILTNNIWSNVIPNASSAIYITPSVGEYRVSATKNGCTIYSLSQIASRNSTPISNIYGINLYPNPSRNLITIDSIQLSQNWENLEIINSEGRICLPNFNITNKKVVRVNISSLNDGVYFVRLRRKDGEFTIIKFTKQ